MSVDISISLVAWNAFLEKNAVASDTEKLLFEAADEFLTESTVERDGGDAWDATDIYNGIRGELHEDLRNICDRCFAACFWNPVQDDLDSLGSPSISPQASFGIKDVDFKGQQVYVQSLISPRTVASLSNEWQSILPEPLELALNSAIDEDSWQDGDCFESPSEWIKYVNEWKAIFEEAAECGRGLLFRVG
jgi:hypothetical protein